MDCFVEQPCHVFDEAIKFHMKDVSLRPDPANSPHTERVEVGGQ